jgi:hypothetical protein
MYLVIQKAALVMTELNLYVLSWLISFALAWLVVIGLWDLGSYLYYKWWNWRWERRRRMRRHLP